MIKIDENETVILEKRKHWFIIFSKTFTLGVAFIFGIIFSIALIQFVHQPLIVVLAAFWSLVIWIAFFILWTDFYLDTLIVTDKRIIDIEQKGLFLREVAMMWIGNIQDLTVEVKGVLHTFLSIGDIHIQTAGEQREFIITGLHNPEAIKEQIRAAYEKVATRQNN